MHDLDKERRERQLARQAALGERTFILGGEQFLHVTDCPYDVIKRAAEIQELTGPEVFWEMEACVIRLIEPGVELMTDGEGENKGRRVSYEPPRYEDHERFRELLRRRDDPIVADDVSSLLRWLMGATTGRPTVPSLESTPGSPESGISSTATSSPQPDEALRI